jgi:predicted Zn-dependent protease
MNTTPQALVEHALVTSTADDCIVIVSDSTSANLRWANNTLTTNGVMHGISVTVISFIKAAEGIRTGSVTGSASSPAQVASLAEAADAAARAGSAAEDADLMVEAYWSAGARTAHEGQSVYSQRGGGTRIGDMITREGVNLFSDPTYDGLACAPFTMAATSDNTESVFDNGLPLGRTDWIRDGRLTSLLQTRHTAAMTGQPVTPMIDNLVLSIDDATGTVEDLVADTQRGLLVTCLWYTREVDAQTLLLTGLTRDGVYLVENGEITAAVNNFRWNESPVDLLRRFTHASATVPSFSREWGDDYFSRTATPALRVPDFNMSSVSQAL